MPAVHPSPAAYRHVLGLRVVRRFLPEPVTSEDLQAVLEAGRWTGSAKNRQGWAFIVVDEGADRERLATAGDFTGPLLAAPLAIVLVRRPSGNDFDLGRVAQNMMLAAAARGLGSCPVTLHRREEAHAILELPEGYEALWSIALGYPDETEEPDQRRQAAAMGLTGRRPLAQLVHHGRFGNPFV